MHLRQQDSKLSARAGARAHTQGQDHGVSGQNHSAMVVSLFQSYGLFLDGEELVAGVDARIVRQNAAELIVSDGAKDTRTHLRSHLDDGDGETTAQKHLRGLKSGQTGTDDSHLSGRIRFAGQDIFRGADMILLHARQGRNHQAPRRRQL